MKAAERSSVQWGTTQIPYLIRRSTRRSTVSVTVEPSGDVVLTAPASVQVARLDRVVRERARWILEHVRRRSDLPRAPEHEFVSGESFAYLGRSYRLRVVAGERAGVRLDRGRFVVTVPSAVPAVGRPEVVRRALVEWYREHAAERLRERVTLWATKVKVRVTDVLLREQRQRWASCDPAGRLRFNWRIAQAPMSLVDYVVVHELVHRVHKDHTRQFWAMLGRVMPDYEVRKEGLRRRGPGMVW